MPKIILSLLLFFCLAPQLVFAQAQSPIGFQKELAEKAGFGTAETGKSLFDYLAIVVQAALALVGVLFFAYMFYGGYMWFTAAGNEEQVKRAQDAIKHAIIGLVVTIGAYSITAFVLSKLL